MIGPRTDSELSGSVISTAAMQFCFLSSTKVPLCDRLPAHAGVCPRSRDRGRAGRDTGVEPDACPGCMNGVLPERIRHRASPPL